jgi:hypothetical protein
MADAGQIRAGRAAVELGLNDSAFNAGLKKAADRLKAWGAGITAAGASLAKLGAAITAPFAGALGTFTSLVSEMAGLSQRTGIAVEEVSSLAYAAQRSGVSVESLAAGIKHMERTLFEASQGSASARKSLALLGLPIKELKGLAPDQALLRMSDAFAQIEDPSRKAGLAMAIFGKSGTDMLPALNKGSEGLHSLIDGFRAMGGAITSEDVATVKQYKGILADFKAMTLSVGLAVARALLPGIIELRQMLVPIAAGIAAFARENAGLVRIIFKLGTGLVVAGTALVIVGKVVTTVGVGLATLASVAGLGLATIASGVAFLLSPIGLVLTATAGLTAAFLYLTEAGAGIRSALGGALGAIGAIFKETWGGILDAVNSGDLSLAFKVAWAGAKVVWYGALAALQDQWIGFTSNFLRAWVGVIALLQKFWEDWKTDFLNGIDLIQYQLGIITKEEGAARTNNRSARRDEAARQIGEQYQRDIAGIGQRESERGRGLTDDLVAARQELDRLSKEAAAKRADQAKQVAEGAKAAKPFPGMPGGEAVGTTSAAGALRIAGGRKNWGEQTVDRLEKILKVNQKQIDEMRRLGLRFS